MRLFSPSKPSPIIVSVEHEFEELQEQNERLRRLVVTLKKRVDALQSKVSSTLAGQHIPTDTLQVNAQSFEKNRRVH
jgi:hypothetical protein